MMIENRLILIGGGGHCKSVIDVAESAGFEILGILDVKEKIGVNICNYKVIGSDEDIVKYIDKSLFLITVGQIKNYSLREKLTQKVKDLGGKFATIVSKNAIVSKYSSIGEGSVIMHQAVVNAGAVVGIGCIINTFVNIEHDACVGDFSHISTGAIINGDCKIGKYNFIGSQSVISNGVTVSDRNIVSIGSVVKSNISITGIYSGNPARLIKSIT